MKIEIKAATLDPKQARVLLDGLDISASLRSLELVIERGQVNCATISIDVHEIDIDAQSLATLQALVALKEQAAHDEALLATQREVYDKASKAFEHEWYEGVHDEGRKDRLKALLKAADDAFAPVLAAIC